MHLTMVKFCSDAINVLNFCLNLDYYGGGEDNPYDYTKEKQ